MDAKLKIGTRIGVYWQDVRVYHDGELYGTSQAYTEGILADLQTDHILIKDPETIITNDTGTKNHPESKPLYYLIPRSLVKDISIY